MGGGVCGCGVVTCIFLRTNSCHFSTSCFVVFNCTIHNHFSGGGQISSSVWQRKQGQPCLCGSEIFPC